MPSVRDRNVKKLKRMKKRAKARMKAKLDQISSGKSDRLRIRYGG